MTATNPDLIKITEAVILIRINKAFKSSLDEEALYYYTRGRWKVNL